MNDQFSKVLLFYKQWQIISLYLSEIKISVEETSPHFSGHSSVRPW